VIASASFTSHALPWPAVGPNFSRPSGTIVRIYSTWGTQTAGGYLLPILPLRCGRCVAAAKVAPFRAHLALLLAVRPSYFTYSHAEGWLGLGSPGQPGLLLVALDRTLGPFALQRLISVVA